MIKAKIFYITKMKMKARKNLLKVFPHRKNKNF